MSGVGRSCLSFIGVNESATLLLMKILLIMIVKLLLLWRRFVVVVGSKVLGRFAFDVILMLLLLVDVRRRVVKSADVGDDGLAFYFDRMRQHDLPL